MKPFSPRNFFIFSSLSRFINPITISEIHHESVLLVSHFSTSPNSFHSSRRHEEETRNVRVSVWWDFENCTLPAGANVFRVSQSITAAIRANGIKGPIQITAFGDVLQLSRSNQEALSSTGINLTHIPHGGKNSADRSLLVDLMYWVSQNPPPAHLFLISGDRDFASILHRLRMNNYNILLASPDRAPGVLCSAASIMWQWKALVMGGNLTGKHFNQPPDGPYGSWYGHYRVPLEDPFAVTEQPTCSRAEELTESGSDPKLRPVPKAVMKQIRHILTLYPKGVSITELRSELWKTNVSIDKDLYGYKKFSHFLLSMPQILKLQSGSDGQHLVCGIAPKVTESSEATPGISTGPVINSGEADFATSPKVNGGDSSCTGGVDEKPSLPLSPKMNVKEPLTKLQEPPKQVEEPPTKGPDPPPLIQNMNNAELTESHSRPLEEQDPVSEVGFFKRIWRKWFGGKDGGSEGNIRGKPENYSPTSYSNGKVKETKETCVESTSQCADPVGPASFPSSSNEAIIDTNIAKSCEANDDKSGREPGFFNNLVNWCRFGRGSQHSDNLGEQYSEKTNRVNIDSEKQEIFSKDSFWNDMVAFIDTPKGSELVLQSRNRKQMAQNLQKQGPYSLRFLRESDLLQLVDILISDKKWVEECPSQTYPFKLVGSAIESSFSNAPSSNGLRSSFLGTSSQPSSHGLLEHDDEKRRQNLPPTGVSAHDIHKKPFGKSRSEILADCQKFVDEMVKEYPEGFEMGSFRKLFFDRYGYHLHLQELGHNKLATFLQIMHGVKKESNYIIPSNLNISCTIANSESELSDASRTDDDHDSQWEELGPVVSSSPNRNEAIGEIHHDYEPLSTDYLSDSEEETLSDGPGKPRIEEEDSSLLKILDSWHSDKDDNNRRVVSENAGGHCSRNDLKPSSISGVGVNRETPAVKNHGRKQRPPKSYSFVSDQLEDKDKLIDGILGTLKMSGDRSAESRVQG